MKRILSLIIIAVMIACVFTSCDYVDDILGGISGEDESKTTITAEQWKNADSITNFTMNFVVKTTNNNGNLTIHRTYEITETASRFQSKQFDSINTSSDDTYHVIDNGQKYKLTKFNRELSQWDKVWHAYKHEWEPQSMMYALGFGLDIDYDDLDYDREKNAYVYTMSEDDLVGIISYYFEEGVLIKVTAYTYEGVKLSDINDDTPRVEAIDVVFTKIGTTEVRPPNYTVED